MHSLGAGAASSLLAPVIGDRGLEAMTAGHAVGPKVPAPNGIRLDANENPDGPGQAALEALRGWTSEANRYPKDVYPALRAAAATSVGAAPENIQLSAGSTDILRGCVYAFTSPTRALVMGRPSFEMPAVDAARIGTPVRAIDVTTDLKLDLAAMVEAAPGAGLVYLCNPNNPTATVHGANPVRDFIARTLRDTPDLTILVDEAYHEYVAEPTYATMVPLALENPRVVVARTCSKVHGLAGMRVGYAIAQPATIAAIGRHVLFYGVTQLSAAAAAASLGARDHVAQEVARNHEAREFTRQALADAGYPSTPSDANFIMVDIRRDAKQFRTDCESHGVLVGRLFPPLTTHARISIGTMDEMRRAVEVFRTVLVTA